MVRNTFLLLCLSSLVSTAAPRVASVASGDCEDAGLQGFSRAFDDALKGKLKEGLLDATQASQKLRPRPSASREDLQRQLTQAQKHFYSLNQSKAEQQLDEALQEIERLPPNSERRELRSTAYALRGVFRLGANKNTQADEAFAQILRSDPNYQLDPDYYSPSTRDRFEQVRKKLSTSPRKTIQVTSTPAGAEVLLDGYSMGKTPASVKVVPGTYQLRVAKENKLSFPHVVNASEDTQANIDLTWEGSVKPGSVVCLSEQPTRGELLASSARVGTNLGVEEVVLIRVRRTASGGDWLTATLLNARSGQEVREGGMKLPSILPPGGFDDLAGFVTTGRPSAGVVSAEGGGAPWVGGMSDRPSTSSSGASKAVAEEMTTVSPSGGSLRSKAWIPLVAGGAAAAGGVLFMVLAKNTESALRNRDPGITDVNGTVALGKAQEKWGWGLLITGAVSLAAGGAMYAFGGETPSATVGFVPVEGGGVSMFSTTW